MYFFFLELFFFPGKGLIVFHPDKKYLDSAAELLCSLNHLHANPKMYGLLSFKKKNGEALKEF